MKSKSNLKRNNAFNMYRQPVIFLLATLVMGCSAGNVKPKIPMLSRAPFVMPDEFPLPDGSKILQHSKALKGGDAKLRFSTALNSEKLIAFYRRNLTAHGLVEDPDFYDLRTDSFRLAFAGWPAGKTLSIRVDSGKEVDISLWTRKKDLPSPPMPKFRPAQVKRLFDMPDGLPIPDNATQVRRMKFGNTCTITFHTQLSLTDLIAFYRKALHPYGIYESADFSSMRIDTLSMAFIGWPGGKKLGMNASDTAYSYDKDIRTVNFQY